MLDRAAEHPQSVAGPLSGLKPDHAHGHPQDSLQRAIDSCWLRRPAALGPTGGVKAGDPAFKDRISGNIRIDPAGEDYAFEIRIADGASTCQPAGRDGADALAKLCRIAVRLEAIKTSESPGVVVIDPEKQEKRRVRLEDSFDDCIIDAEKRGAMEARESALLVKTELLSAVPVIYADAMSRDRLA